MVRHLKTIIFILLFKHSLRSFTVCLLMVVITGTYVLRSAYRIPSIFSLLCRIRLPLFDLFNTIRIFFHLLFSGIINRLRDLIRAFFEIDDRALIVNNLL